MAELVTIPDLGTFSTDSGFLPRTESADSAFAVGRDGVRSITATGDGRVEFIAFVDHTLAYVRSAVGYPAIYPVRPVRLQKPVRAVLMDLDGTSVRSEGFWIWVIEQTVASLLEEPAFELEPDDLAYVSGHSVSEHLQFCIMKYCPDATLEDARRHYLRHARREMADIAAGRGRSDVFQPAPGLKEFLLELKAMGVRIGLVSSGLHEKAYPEILAAFRTMALGSPEAFYDTIITAGYPLGPGGAGTLGELTAKPHPWLYAEAFRVGLGLPLEERHSVVGIEDSGAGVCAIRLAGMTPIGMAGGNIAESGTEPLCLAICDTFAEALEVIR